MKLGVIGAKLGHTASPAIHEKLFKILQVEGQHQYGVLEMDRNDIPMNFSACATKGIREPMSPFPTNSTSCRT